MVTLGPSVEQLTTARLLVVGRQLNVYVKQEERKVKTIFLRQLQSFINRLKRKKTHTQ